MINVPLLKQTLAHIEANPSEWDQSWYRCDTGMCFAVWAAQLAGGKWYSNDLDSDSAGYLIAEDGDDPHTIDVPDDDHDVPVVHASVRAKRVLGLTGGQACELFAGGNTLPELQRIVADLIREAS